MKRLLLVNPPVYDFAAHDFWMKPLGLLNLGGYLRGLGYRVGLLDTLDKYHPALKNYYHPRVDTYGRGKFFYKEIAKPRPLKFIRRKFKRFGLPDKEIHRLLIEQERPDLVLVTSGMTYWYPGVREVIEMIKGQFPSTPVLLGGIYASLLPEHARLVSGADAVIPSSRGYLLNKWLDLPDKTHFSPPAWDLYKRLDYGVIKVSSGCPYECTYCASRILEGTFSPRDYDEIREELNFLLRLGVKDIAFYDDILLHPTQKTLINLLEGWRSPEKIPLRFHTPNGLLARSIDKETARFLKDWNFDTIYVGLESADPERQRSTGGKVSCHDLADAVDCLDMAGYKRPEITVYVMIGFPNQSPEEVEHTVSFVHSLGARVMLSEYSPVPGTSEYKKAGPFLLSNDPLLHNPSVFPTLTMGKTEVQRFKDLVNQFRRDLYPDYSRCS